MGLMLNAAISAQTVSTIPNWKTGDKASFSVEQKDTKKSEGQSSTSVKTVTLNLKVVDKKADGYVINAAYQNPKTSSEDQMEQALFKVYEKLSFDYKLDASGKVVGLADSTKTISTMKGLMDEAAKTDKTLAFLFQMMGSMMSDDMYLAGILDEVTYIHSLDGLTLESKKTVDQTASKSTMFGFSVSAPNHYTLESVNGNIANVKCTAEVGNDILLPAFVDFSIEMAKGFMNGMSGLLQTNDQKEVDMDKVMKEQRAEIENKIKDKFDLKISDKFNYSFDKSTQWITSMTGTSTLKGKVEDKDADVTTQITIKKK